MSVSDSATRDNVMNSRSLQTEEESERNLGSTASLRPPQPSPLAALKNTNEWVQYHAAKSLLKLIHSKSL